VTSTRAVRAAAAAGSLLALVVVSGCGAADDPKADPPPSPSASTSTSASPSRSASASTSLPPEPRGTAPNDVKTTTTTSALPVPEGGPPEVAHFPVPEGVRVKGPGPTDRSWQFDIRPADTDEVLAFYRKALVDKGYTVQNNVNLKIGIENVHYDIQFSGPAEGYIVADKPAKDVFVLVESLPAD